MITRKDEARKRRIKPHTPEYQSVHYWASHNIVDPKICEHCGATDRKLSWANKTGQYLKVAEDWLRLCKPCHSVYDLRTKHCKNGHLLEGNNVRLRAGNPNRIICKPCQHMYMVRHKDRDREHFNATYRKWYQAKYNVKPRQPLSRDAKGRFLKTNRNEDD